MNAFGITISAYQYYQYTKFYFEIRKINFLKENFKQNGIACNLQRIFIEVPSIPNKEHKNLNNKLKRKK